LAKTIMLEARSGSIPEEVIIVVKEEGVDANKLRTRLAEGGVIIPRNTRRQGMKLNKKHYVVVDAKDSIEINPDAIRVARYLRMVNKLIEKYPDTLKELEKHSLECKLASQL